METKRTAVFVVCLLASCSAFRLTDLNPSKDIDEIIQKSIDLMLKPFQILGKSDGWSDVRLSPNIIVTSSNFLPAKIPSKPGRGKRIQWRETLSSPTTQSNKISSIQRELPLPVVPNFSVALAPLYTLGHQVLGLVPKSAPLTSNMLWIDNIQIPEDVQLVLVLIPDPHSLSANNFQPLYVIPKDAVSLNFRIINYSFPHLRIRGGFLSPSNSYLVIAPAGQQPLSVLCLGLLPNDHPSIPKSFQALSNANHVPLNSAVSHGQVISKQSLPVMVADPLPSIVPYFVVPSPPLPLSQPTLVAEANLLRSLQQFLDKDANLRFIREPDNFELVPVSPDTFRTSLKSQHAVGLIPKSIPVSDDFIQFKPLDPEYQDLWADYQVVADNTTSPAPSFFQPFIVVPIGEPMLNDNGVKLPFFVTRNTQNPDTSISLQFVLVRNLYELMPAQSFMVLCLVPKSQFNNSAIPTNSTDSDVLDYPAMQPRLVLTTTTEKPTTIATVGSALTLIDETPIAPKTVTAAVSNQSYKQTESSLESHTDSGKQSDTGFRPLPSKKSWKNRLLPVIEPSVTVVKRTPGSVPTTAVERSIFNLLGLF